MKYLIAGDRKVLRKGDFVHADESAHEFIYDTSTVDDDKDVTVAVLKSIAENNGIHINKNANRGDLIHNLNLNLKLLELPEQNKMSQSDIIKSVVEEAAANRPDGVDNDQFEVDIFMACIDKLKDEGVTFKIKQLGNLVKKEIADQGLMITAGQRKELISDILTKADFNPTEWDEVEAMLEKLVKEVQDTERGQALAGLKKYMKDNELEMPKRAKKAKVAFRQAVINFMIENCPVSDEALLEFITAADKKDPEKVVERLSSLKETIDQAFAAGVDSVQADQAAA